MQKLCRNAVVLMYFRGAVGAVFTMIAFWHLNKAKCRCHVPCALLKGLYFSSQHHQRKRPRPSVLRRRNRGEVLSVGCKHLSLQMPSFYPHGVMQKVKTAAMIIRCQPCIISTLQLQSILLMAAGFNLDFIIDNSTLLCTRLNKMQVLSVFQNFENKTIQTFKDRVKVSGYNVIMVPYQKTIGWNKMEQ